MFTKIWRVVLATCLGCAITASWAQPVTVVEYYNKTLDAYFITGRTNEQQQLDSVADFKRTGMSFQAVTANSSTFTTRICRFYIATTSPFSSTHFYGREGTDCEFLRSQNLQGFTWEDYDFAIEQPIGGACPSTSTAIYRSFRAAANGKTANHRYSASGSSYVAAESAGYVGEQAAFCATSATDVTPPPTSQCGTFYYPNVRVSYQSLSNTGIPDSWVRLNGQDPVTFNGTKATPVVDRYSASPSKLTMIQETLDTWAELGTNTQDSQGTLETYYDAPTVYSRHMMIGQQVSVNRTVITNPSQTYGNGTQTGVVTYVGQENVSVDAGTFDACKFSSEIKTVYATIGRTEVAKATIWVGIGTGIVKSVTEETITTSSSPAQVVTSTEVNAVAVQPL